MTFTTEEIAKKTSLSLRQLQVWDETGLVAASRCGQKRIYDAAAIKELLIISELKRKQMSTQKIRVVMSKLREEGKITANYLLTDGKEVWLRYSQSDALNTAVILNRAVCVVAL